MKPAETWGRVAASQKSAAAIMIKRAVALYHKTPPPIVGFGAICAPPQELYIKGPGWVASAGCSGGNGGTPPQGRLKVVAHPLLMCCMTAISIRERSGGCDRWSLERSGSDEGGMALME